MTAVPTTLTAVAGAVLTASQWNTNNRDVENWLLAPAILRVRQTSVQSLANNTGTAVVFDTEDVDSTGMHSTVTNTSRATAVYPGWYWTGGNVSYAANATGIRTTAWMVGGVVQPGAGVLFIASATASNRLAAASSMFFLNVGDYLELQGFQNSGGSLNTSVTASEQPSMSLHWVSN